MPKNSETELQRKGYEFIRELENKAYGLCDAHDISGITFLVTEIRRIERLIRNIPLRFGDE